MLEAMQHIMRNSSLCSVSDLTLMCSCGLCGPSGRLALILCPL